MNLLQKLLTPFLPSKMKRMIKASQLSEQGEYEAAIRTFEEEIGIDRADRENTVVLREKVEQWLSRHGRGDYPMMFVAQYASSFGLIRQYVPSLVVLEAALGLEIADYRNSAALASKLDRFWFELQDETRFMLWMGLHGVFSIVGRASEALDVFKYDLGIFHLKPEEDEHTYKEAVKVQINRKIAVLQPDIAAAYLTFIFPLFEGLSLQREGLELFEKILGLIPEDYEKPTHLSKKLNKWINGLQNPLTGKFAMLGLSGSLYQIHEERKALMILESYPGIGPSDYENIELLSQKWQALRDNLPTDTAATYHRMLISMLETVRRESAQEIKALIQADCGLRDSDFESYESVGQKLSERTALFQEDTKAAYLFSIGETLSKTGFPKEAAMVTEWFVSQHRNLWEIPPAGDPAIVHIIAILSNWFRFFYQAPGGIVLVYCRQTLAYLRHGFVSHGMRLEDRKDFIHYTTLLKSALLEAGFYQLAQQTSEEAESALALEVLLWDVELTQRVLAERFVLEVRAVFPPDPSIQANHWAFAEPMPTLYANITAGISGRVQKDAPLTDGGTDLFDTPWDSPSALTEDAQVLSDGNSPLLVTLKQTINRAITGDTVAKAIGKDALIVRITFQNDGRLIWLAFSSDGEQLTFAKKYTGNISDRADIEHFTQAHEDEVRLYWRLPSERNKGRGHLALITKYYLENLSPLLRLDLLTDLLHESLHLVLQVDGSLYAVPFSYLPIQAKPLFLNVASISQSLSLLFQVLQKSLQRSVKQEVQAIKKIAVASWFEQQEREVFTRAAARQLHAGHFSIAQEYGMQCFSIADHPSCSIKSLAGLVQQYREIDLLTICGHGHPRLSGIRLKNDSLWRGNGSDLSGVGLLLMVSCSIGRINADKNLDVDGFCIQLAVNRAFSVIACRWPIDSWEACLFANEIAEKYLSVSCTVEDTADLPVFSKAKALNDARKKIYEAVGDMPVNTLAAFEFYGLG